MSAEWRNRLLWVGVVVSGMVVIQAGLYLWDAIKP